LPQLYTEEQLQYNMHSGIIFLHECLMYIYNMTKGKCQNQTKVKKLKI